jgi:hypothetical protein
VADFFRPDAERVSAFGQGSLVVISPCVKRGTRGVLQVFYPARLEMERLPRSKARGPPGKGEVPFSFLCADPMCMPTDPASVSVAGFGVCPRWGSLGCPICRWVGAREQEGSGWFPLEAGGESPESFNGWDWVPVSDG